MFGGHLKDVSWPNVNLGVPDTISSFKEYFFEVFINSLSLENCLKTSVRFRLFPLYRVRQRSWTA